MLGVMLGVMVGVMLGVMLCTSTIGIPMDVVMNLNNANRTVRHLCLLLPRLYNQGIRHRGSGQCFTVPLTIELRPSPPTQRNFLTGFLVPTSEVR